LPTKTAESAKILTSIDPLAKKKLELKGNNVSVLVVVRTLFRNCHTITIKSTGLCDLSTV